MPKRTTPEGVLFVEFLESLPEDDPSRVFLNEWRAYREPTIDTRNTLPGPPWRDERETR